jgi:hypothetical protein
MSIIYLICACSSVADSDDFCLDPELTSQTVRILCTISFKLEIYVQILYTV